MKIAIVGTRGIPANYGGFETFAEELSVRLVKNGYYVTVFCEKRSNHFNEFRNVALEFVGISKSKNPIKYYFFSLYKALKEHDIIIITGSTGAIFSPIKLLLNKNSIIITNTDGIEYLRDKWSFIKKIFIRFADFIAAYFSNYLIADSKGIKEHLLTYYKLINKSKVIQIEYGAYPQEFEEASLISNYYLIVARLEPENNIEMIIKGFLNSDSNKELIIIGNLQETEYVKNLLSYQSSSVKFVGGVYKKDELVKFRSGCFAYFHGHSVGGTNPSLLEAMGCFNITICHDNIFNREVTANNMFYFKNSNELSKIINEFEKFDTQKILSLKKVNYLRIINYYNWDNITYKYLKFLDNFKGKYNVWQSIKNN